MQQQEPTRHDLEFMADMLGCVEQCTIGGPPDMRHKRRYGGIPTAMLATAVAAGTRDPIANARAQQRIGELLMQCEHILVGYARVGDDCFHCGRPFHWLAGIHCRNKERHAQPVPLDQYLAECSLSRDN